MRLVTRRRLLIAAPLVVLLLVAAAVLFLARGDDLQARAARTSMRMTREEVEAILGPPVLVLNRTGGRGVASVWVDQFWQVEVRTVPDDRVEVIERRPSDSFVRRTVGRLVPLPQ